jgi:hypothetical protein
LSIFQLLLNFSHVLTVLRIHALYGVCKFLFQGLVLMF